MFVIDNDDSFKEFKDMVASGEATVVNTIGDVLEVIIDKKLIQIEVDARYSPIFRAKPEVDGTTKLMYGKDTTKGIVNISVIDDETHIFRRDGASIIHETKPFKQWVLSPKDFNGFSRLKGNQHFQYIKLFSQDEFDKVRNKIFQKELYTVWNKQENYMIHSGATYFKDLKSTDLSVVSFDIETTGLNKEASDAEVLIITNTFRNFDGTSERKAFIISDYEDQQDMIHDWCAWVTNKDPDILLGHNIVIYDLPYLDHQYRKKYPTNLPLGRIGGELSFAERTSEFRKDGSQSYSYNKVTCFGREVVDTFFLAIKADIARKYESYGLKSIVRQEGLEKADRSFIDASKIKQYYNNRHTDPETWEKTIQYAIEDSDDALKLFDLMVAPFFYFTPHIPKPFQQMMESATGSQLNSFMVRSYLQDGFAVAQASSTTAFEGAISFGNPGIYSNCQKWDVASLYPSIMRLHKIGPGKKDYNNNFNKMLEFFTIERLKNKQLGKETGDRFYKDLEQSQKVGINSCYGFLGASGLNYNNPVGAADVTRKGREILMKAISWAEAKGFGIVNSDTDAIMVSDGNARNSDLWKDLLEELNSQYDSMIRFEDDGFFPKVIVLKAKNYILYDGKKIKLKGSSLRDQKKEPALRELLDTMINSLVFDKNDLCEVYHKYITEACCPTDIKRWATKKTVTKAILNCATDPEARLNERKVYDAIADKTVQEGDKIYLYPAILSKEIQTTTLKNGKIKEKVIKTTGLKCVGDEGEIDTEKLVERVYATLEILTNVVDTNQFIDYTLVKNKPLLTELMENA